MNYHAIVSILIAALIMCGGVVLAQDAATQKSYNLELSYQNGGLGAKSIVLEDLPAPDRRVQPQGGWLCEIYSIENKVIASFKFLIPVTTCRDVSVDGDKWGGGCQTNQQTDFNLIAPYYPNAVSLAVYSPWGEQAFAVDTIKFADLCGDNVCEANENYLTCPGDCRSGVKDGVCDRVADGVCDADCPAKDDQDCPQGIKIGYIILSFFGAAALASLVWLALWRAKNKKEILSTFLVLLMAAICFPISVFGAEGAAKNTQVVAGNYLWQTLEVGDLGGVENKAQFAGFKFTAKKDAYVSELCGYFKGTHAVNLYNSVYQLKASMQITSYEQWNCAPISPIAITKGQNYYVVAEIPNDIVYYRASNDKILPRKNADATIENGVTQEINKPFGANLVFNSKRIFGLVDIKITPSKIAQPLIEKAGASLVQALDVGAGIGDALRNCAHGKCIVCDANECRFISDSESAGQTENSFIQLCAKGKCYSCTNSDCGQTDAAGVVKTGYSFKNCANNKCVNCLNNRCSIIGGQVPKYDYHNLGGFPSGGSIPLNQQAVIANQSIFNNSGGGGGGGGGGYYDPKAAAEAMATAIVNKQFGAVTLRKNNDFINALNAYFKDASAQTGYTNTVPTFAQFANYLNAAYAIQQGDPSAKAINVNEYNAQQQQQMSLQLSALMVNTQQVMAAQQAQAAGGIKQGVMLQIKGDQSCLGSVCVSTNNTTAVSALKSMAETGIKLNTSGSVQDSPSQLTTGWGEKMNAPVVTYVNIPVSNVSVGDTLTVPLLTMGANGQVVFNGSTTYVIPSSPYSPKSSELADQINSHHYISVPIRVAESSAGLLNSQTAAIFSGGGTQAGSPSAPQVSVQEGGVSGSISQTKDGGYVLNYGGKQTQLDGNFMPTTITPSSNFIAPVTSSFDSATAASQVVSISTKDASDWLPANYSDLFNSTKSTVDITKGSSMNLGFDATNPIARGSISEISGGTVGIVGPAGSVYDFKTDTWVSNSQTAQLSNKSFTATGISSQTTQVAQTLIDQITSGMSIGGVTKNPENSVWSRPSDLTTGWGEKFNAPVAKDANGNPMYIQMNVGQDLAVGSTFPVPLLIQDSNGQIRYVGSTTEVVESSNYMPNYSEQAQEINRAGGNILVPVREAVYTAGGVLQSETTQTFTGGGTQAGSSSAPQVSANVPGANVIGTMTVNPNGGYIFADRSGKQSVINATPVSTPQIITPSGATAATQSTSVITNNTSASGGLSTVVSGGTVGVVGPAGSVYDAKTDTWVSSSQTAQVSGKTFVATGTSNQTTQASQALIDQITSGMSIGGVTKNPENSVWSRPSDLTTGWGEKFNAPVAKDANGNPMYVQMNVGQDVSKGSTFEVPLLIKDNKGEVVYVGSTTEVVEPSAYNAKGSEQAQEINRVGGNILVPVREAVYTAGGVLQSETTQTFTGGGTQAGSPSAPQVSVNVPGANVIGTIEISQDGGYTFTDSGGRKTTIENNSISEVIIPSGSIISVPVPSGSFQSSSQILPSEQQWNEGGYGITPSIDAFLVGEDSAAYDALMNNIDNGDIKWQPIYEYEPGTLIDSQKPMALNQSPLKNYFEIRNVGLYVKNMLANASYLLLAANEPSASSEITDAPQNTGPIVIGYNPTITNDTTPTINIKTDRKAVCKAAPYDLQYEFMWSVLESTDGTNHQKKFGQLNDGTYLFYIRCVDGAGNLNVDSQKIAFIVDKNYDEKIAANTVPPAINEVVANAQNSNVDILASVKSQVPILGVEARLRDKDGHFVAALMMKSDGKNDNWNYSWQKISGVASGQYFVDIFAKDASGNFSEQKNAANFTLSPVAISDDCQDVRIGGDSSKKIDIIFVPCGYGNDLASFEADARQQIEQFSKISPLAENIEKFNFRLARVGGLDCAADLEDNMVKDTQMFMAAARKCLPDAVIVLKKQSDQKEKGISLAGTGIGFIAADQPFTAVHEVGHAFFNLNDEYSYGCTYVDMSQSPNCDNSPKCEKWSDIEDAGCYSGCTCEGNYRSSDNSVMFDPENATQFSPAASRQILKIFFAFE